LKRLLKSLGELRDVQVQQLALAAELSRYPEVGGLWIELGRREQKLIQSAARSLDGFKLGKIRRQLEEVQAGLKNPAARLAAKAVLGESILRATQQAFEATAERACDIDADEVSTVHRVRTAYKKFRYMVEALPAALGRPSEAQAAAMAEYQQAMGAIQDVDVLLNLVADHGAQDPGVAWSLESFRKALLDRRTWLVDEFIARADALYSFWPLQSAPLGILQTAV
jgi:CHAD domain-containing protein